MNGNGEMYSLGFALVDMFGFKIEVPKREGSLKDKTRPIYLDMQASQTYISLDRRPMLICPPGHNTR
jgi:hypothetical protein